MSDKSCDCGCSSTNSCGKCTSCKSCPPSDPCSGVSCGSNAYCSGGSCYCNSGYEGNASSGCTAVSKDPCKGVSCSGGKVCSNDSCVCPSGKKECNGSCISTSECCGGCTSPYYCYNGTCTCSNKSCGKGQVCTATNSCGGCTACACPSGKYWDDIREACGCQESGCESYRGRCSQTHNGVCIGGTLQRCTFKDFGCSSYNLEYCC